MHSVHPSLKQKFKKAMSQRLADMANVTPPPRTINHPSPPNRAEIV
jgi:hypothetical protein